ncbi:MAG TPA: protein-disulfide reductase DsbD domain-containing protein [Rubricoccaceae bacterium]
MRPSAVFAVLIAAVCALASAARAQPASPLVGADPTPHSDVRLVAGAAAVAGGDSLWVAVEIAQDAGWHVYWTNPGDSGLPVRAAWTLPDGATAGPLRFPAPERLDIAGLTSYAHSGTPRFLTRVAVPAAAADPFEVSASVSYLVCADVCLPARATVRLSVPVARETRPATTLDAALAALPRAATDWTAEATAVGETLRLRLVPPAGWAGDWAAAQFFPDTSGVVRHAAPQTFRPDGPSWTVDLAGGDRVPAVLSGVLVAPGAPAVVIKTDVAGGSAVATAGAGVGLWAALGLALVGGLLLNVMPCVFPVLSLKLLSFAGSTDPRATRRTGVAYGVGVVVSFWVLVGALLALRAGGAGLGWGFQLQSPPVIAFLAVLMTGLALNLLGVVEVGGRIAAAGGALDRGTGVRGAFASGVLATVVATPCTAPFTGAALGFALAQPAPAAVAVFTALGVGMALPLVALAFVPGLATRLPRPGPWMETTRQALAFPLFATVVWLVWVFANQAGVNGAAALLLALVLVGFAAWLVGRWPLATSAARPRVAARLTAAAALLAAVGLVGMAVRGETADGWEPYDAARAEAVVAAGTPLFIDATAAWCLSCQVNERTSLGTREVSDAFERAGAVRMRADWTTNDPAITALLTRFGRSGVPMYAWYAGSGAAPRLLPEVLTPGVVLDALAEAPRSTASR